MFQGGKKKVTFQTQFPPPLLFFFLILKTNYCYNVSLCQGYKQDGRTCVYEEWEEIFTYPVNLLCQLFPLGDRHLYYFLRRKYSTHINNRKLHYFCASCIRRLFLAQETCLPLQKPSSEVNWTWQFSSQEEIWQKHNCQDFDTSSLRLRC